MSASRVKKTSHFYAPSSSSIRCLILAIVSVSAADGGHCAAILRNSARRSEGAWLARASHSSAMRGDTRPTSMQARSARFFRSTAFHALVTDFRCFGRPILCHPDWFAAFRALLAFRRHFRLWHIGDSKADDAHSVVDEIRHCASASPPLLC